MPELDVNAAEYRCCCNCCHLKTATVVVGVVELVYLGYVLIGALILIAQVQELPPEKGGKDSALVMVPFALLATGVALGLLVIVLMLLGISMKLPGFLLPHFVLQVRFDYLFELR